MNNKRLNKYIVTTIVSFLGLLLLFLLVSPENKPLPYIFVPVVLAWIFFFSLAKAVLTVMFKQESRIRTLMVFVCVSLLVLLGLLSGVGQLSVSDVVLAFSLVIVSTFYFYRMWS